MKTKQMPGALYLQVQYMSKNEYSKAWTFTKSIKRNLVKLFPLFSRTALPVLNFDKINLN